MTATRSPFQITAAVAKLSTADMFAQLETLEARGGEWLEYLNPEELETVTAIVTAIENRHQLSTAALEARAELETAHPFETITHPQVLRHALKSTGQTIADHPAAHPGKSGGIPDREDPAMIPTRDDLIERLRDTLGSPTGAGSDLEDYDDFPYDDEGWVELHGHLDLAHLAGDILAWIQEAREVGA